MQIIDWFKTYVGTFIILSAFGILTFWLNNKFLKLEKDISTIKHMIIYDIHKHEKENDGRDVIYYDNETNKIIKAEKFTPSIKNN